MNDHEEVSVVEFLASIEDISVPVDELIKYIDDLKSKFPEHSNIVMLCQKTELNFYGSRKETDEEMIDRLKNEQKVSQAW